MTDLALQYQGFLNTPQLWLSDDVHGIKQLEINSEFIPYFSNVNHKLRLGKLVERFVSHQLQHDDDINILAENIQIQKEKQTLGELDCLLSSNGKPIHLEIIYKFYLYDGTSGQSELDRWIGPNRKDSLTQKLTKLKDRQLPLLYHTRTKPILERIRFKTKEIEQCVLFKAQLFVPLNSQIPAFNLINDNCIKGIYIKPSELQNFKDCEFYMPEKLDWLKEIQISTTWKTFNEFLEELNPVLNEEKAPLCWIKKANGETIKCFVVWW